MVFVYVFELEENECGVKWWVGSTENCKFDIESYFDNLGSEFTLPFQVKQINEIIPNCNKFYEDKILKKYISKYGLDCVRGGSFGSEFTEQDIKLLLETQEPIFNVSSKLTNMMIKGKNEIEENFVKIITKIDEIMNNIPEEVIGENKGFYGDNSYTFEFDDINYVNFGEMYNPKKVKAIMFTVDYSLKLSDIIVLYESDYKEYNQIKTFPIYTTVEHNIDMKIINTQMYVHKLNEYGFRVDCNMPNNIGFCLRSFYYSSFYVVLDD